MGETPHTWTSSYTIERKAAPLDSRGVALRAVSVGLDVLDVGAPEAPPGVRELDLGPVVFPHREV
jgi:hypothetical protein